MNERADRREPFQLEYRRPGIRPVLQVRRLPTRWIGVISLLVFLALGASIVAPTQCRWPQQAEVFRCAQNLKTIAMAMTDYAGKNNGHYPDRLEDLLPIVSTGEIYTCPASNDVPATGTLGEMTAALSAGGHCSYIYLGKGLTTDVPSETALVYEPLTNHRNKGMNVLFGDLHVEYLDATAAQKMLKSIAPAKPIAGPPGSTTPPRTKS